MSVVKLDIDRKKIDLQRINIVHQLITYWRDMKFRSARVYKTKNGWHVHLEYEMKVSDRDVILMQSLMDSDFKRETLNYIRVGSRKYGDDWNVLFAKKSEYKIGKKMKVVSRERYDRVLSEKLESMLRKKMYG